MSFLEDFFQCLNDSEIEYCVLRNYEKLPVSTGGSDLDLLINQKDKTLFFEQIKKKIYCHKYKVVSFIPDVRCPKLCIAKPSGGFQMDIFAGGVYYEKREIIPSKTLSRYCKTYNGVWVLDRKVSDLLSFLKEILNNITCNQKYISALQNSFSQQEICGELLIQFNVDFRNYLNKYLKVLREEECRQLSILAHRDFSKKWFPGTGIKLKRIFCQPGYTISVLGPDGSGKSTIIEQIIPKLNEPFHNKVYYEHSRPNKFPAIKTLLGKQIRKESEVVNTNPQESKQSGFLGSFARWFYYLMDYTIGFYSKIWPGKAIRSCVWIFDRYYYDYYTDPKRSRILLPNWILKAGQFLIPEPDLILCLATDPKLIHQRKKELPLKEVERQVKALRSFYENHPRAQWVDTGQTIEKSSERAMELIIEMMSKRFESVNLS